MIGAQVKKVKCRLIPDHRVHVPTKYSNAPYLWKVFGMMSRIFTDIKTRTLSKGQKQLGAGAAIVRQRRTAGLRHRARPGSRTTEGSINWGGRQRHRRRPGRPCRARCAFRGAYILRCLLLPPLWSPWFRHDYPRSYPLGWRWVARLDALGTCASQALPTQTRHIIKCCHHLPDTYIALLGAYKFRKRPRLFTNLCRCGLSLCPRKAGPREQSPGRVGQGRGPVILPIQASIHFSLSWSGHRLSGKLHITGNHAIIVQFSHFWTVGKERPRENVGLCKK